MASVFSSGSTVTFGIPDSPLTYGILESISPIKNSSTAEIADANGTPTGNTIVTKSATFSAKVQLTSVDGASAKVGDAISIGAGSFKVQTAGAVYTQGQYAYQNITAIEVTFPPAT